MGCSPTHDESATRSKDHENHSPKSNSKVVERRERFELAWRHRRLRPVLFMQCYGGKERENTINRKTQGASHCPDPGARSGSHQVQADGSRGKAGLVARVP